MTSSAAFHVVQDARYLRHDAPAGHPERAERLHAVADALDPHRDAIQPLPARPATPDEILRVHDRPLLAQLEQAAARAPGRLDPDTFVSRASHEVALLAAGATIDLALAVAAGRARSGLAAVRPPGHHAEAHRAQGFCLINNVAVAARALQHEAGLGKVLILDWDVHHGNGTQHSFEADPSILYVSLHQFPHYPGTGAFGEAGHGKGTGATVNVPLPAGCGDPEYVGALQRVLVPVAQAFRPEMILVSCGFDAHEDDPLASMRVSEQGYRDMTRVVRALADALCGGRVAFVLEGGYAATGLRAGTRGVIDAMLEEPGQLPAPRNATAGSPLRSVLGQVNAVHGTRYPSLLPS